ncbi:MAG: DUF1345 domain-containing protein [Actinobacteria bacterium]|nr:DUF1345 domain-containing protein [Actinomycetota bacterium]
MRIKETVVMTRRMFERIEYYPFNYPASIPEFRFSNARSYYSFMKASPHAWVLLAKSRCRGNHPCPKIEDLAYVALEVGMAFQATETTGQARAFRRTVLRPAHLSFLFTTTIFAVTITLVANLNA